MHEVTGVLWVTAILAGLPASWAYRTLTGGIASGDHRLEFVLCVGAAVAVGLVAAGVRAWLLRYEEGD